MAAWSESLHPRAPAGAAEGGQFAASGGSKPPAKQAAAKKTVAKKAATATRAAKKTATRKTAQIGMVTVKPGDTLSAIARRAKVTLAQLRKDNPGLFTKAHKGGNLIFPGNKVKITGPAKKTAAKKTTARKTVAKKAATSRTAAKKTTARKTAKK